jgi:hypothetical protein
MSNTTNLVNVLADVYAGEELSCAKRKELLSLYDLIQDKLMLSHGEVSIAQGSSFDVKTNDAIHARLREMILSFATNAEVIGPGSFTHVIKNAIEQRGDVSTWRNAIDGGATRPTLLDVEWLINELNLGNLRHAFEEAVNFAGFAGRIKVEQTSHHLPIVEKSRGYTFDVNVNSTFIGKFRDVRVVAIDGFLEHESEVHGLLESSHNAKEPFLLFIRGMSQDVEHTISVNWQRGTLRAIPIIVPFDVDGINMINDIAVVCGTDVISSHKGQLISAVKYSDLSYVPEVDVWANRITIINAATRVAVNLQIQELRRKRSDVKDELTSLYDKRIKSLSPGLVTIKIPDGVMFRCNRQRVDFALRAYRSLVNHGTVIVNDEKMLLDTAVAVTTYAPKLVAALDDLGAVINVCASQASQ